MPRDEAFQQIFQLSSKLPRPAPVLPSFFPAVPGTAATSIKELTRNRGTSGGHRATTRPADALPRSHRPSPWFASAPFACLLIAFHVKPGAINFGRAAAESLVPPYFHTQGGLQKYVGGATRDVTSVRGLVEGTCAEIFFLFKNNMECTRHTGA